MSTNTFKADANKLLHILTDKIYENKDTAIREIISNASDACNKVIELSNLNKIQEYDTPKILLHLFKEKKELHIIDNGIGLTKDEMINNLGCIAKSGTEDFIKKLEKNSELIGQFGIGFYSTFLIASEVQFYSKTITDINSKWHLWSSEGKETYKIEETNLPQYKDKKYGSVLILKIKEESFLDLFHLKNIIKKYSNHIKTEIYIQEEDKKEERINEGQAIWLRDKESITEQEYLDFLKNKFHHIDKPLSILHNFMEGNFEFVNLFFIPLKKSLGFMGNKTKSDIQLYINKVFIGAESLKILPRFLRFVYGVVDCPSLHLNINRENIQQNKLLQKVQNISTKKILDELIDKSKNNREEYIEFFNNYGEMIKEALCDPKSYNYDEKLKEKILQSCLFYSTKKQKMISLEEFNDKQESILYINAQSIEEGLHNTQVEKALNKDQDVLILTSHVDNFWSSNGFTFNNKSFVSVNHVSNNQKDDQIKQSKDSEICKKFKSVLGNKIQDVFLSTEESSAPISIQFNTMNNMSRQMERYLIQQNHIQEESKPYIEIYQENQLIKAIEQNINHTKIDQIIEILFNEAQIIAGENISDPKKFSNNINHIINIVLSQSNINE